MPDPASMPGLHDLAIPPDGYDDQGQISGVKQVTIGSLNCWNHEPVSMPRHRLSFAKVHERCLQRTDSFVE